MNPPKVIAILICSAILFHTLRSIYRAFFKTKEENPDRLTVVLTQEEPTEESRREFEAKFFNITGESLASFLFYGTSVRKDEDEMAIERHGWKVYENAYDQILILYKINS